MRSAQLLTILSAERRDSWLILSVQYTVASESRTAPLYSLATQPWPFLEKQLVKESKETSFFTSYSHINSMPNVNKKVGILRQSIELNFNSIYLFHILGPTKSCKTFRRGRKIINTN